MSEIARTVDFGWVNISRVNFVVSGPKFTKLSSSNVGGIAAERCFQLVDTVRYPSRRYSRSNSEVVQNGVEFWTFFALQHFRGAGPQKVVPMHILMPASQNVTWKSFVKLFLLAPKLLRLVRRILSTGIFEGLTN